MAVRTWNDKCSAERKTNRLGSDKLPPNKSLHLTAPAALLGHAACSVALDPVDQVENKESRLPRELRIDRAIYLVDDKTRTYRYFRRNPEWQSLSPKENESNKKAIDGYTRIFRGGRARTYKRAEHP